MSWIFASDSIAACLTMFARVLIDSGFCSALMSGSTALGSGVSPSAAAAVAALSYDSSVYSSESIMTGTWRLSLKVAIAFSTSGSWFFL